MPVKKLFGEKQELVSAISLIRRFLALTNPILCSSFLEVTHIGGRVLSGEELLFLDFSLSVLSLRKHLQLQYVLVVTIARTETRGSAIFRCRGYSDTNGGTC